MLFSTGYEPGQSSLASGTSLVHSKMLARCMEQSSADCGALGGEAKIGLLSRCRSASTAINRSSFESSYWIQLSQQMSTPLTVRKSRLERSLGTNRQSH